MKLMIRLVMSEGAGLKQMTAIRCVGDIRGGGAETNQKACLR